MTDFADIAADLEQQWIELPSWGLRFPVGGGPRRGGVGQAGEGGGPRIAPEVRASMRPKRSMR
jgi:hypothetical protein